MLHHTAMSHSTQLGTFGCQALLKPNGHLVVLKPKSTSKMSVHLIQIVSMNVSSMKINNHDYTYTCLVQRFTPEKPSFSNLG